VVFVKVYGGAYGVAVLDKSFGGADELEKYVEQFAVKSEIRDITVALSDNTRNTTVGGELDEEGNVA